ncbi:TetR/AcrR family transcriptional regulator [Pantoea sp. Ap-967]|uniref:TetR/AcrR family transcriptional regulator n=1 Tax=Pantoea sp. Ap-967 TaxID=2608362 RepID=UPI00141E2577|nr:TetR/AcrR family transcriptional regulator [Pantoea sp. Ap-967]NIE72961.1 TetR/AcrR family transcriptional regulator [Pantoea sp. Ap-967]
MPRFVDHDQRRRDIAFATIQVIAREGLKGLSISAVAKELGGTVTLVTHYYSSKSALIDDLAEQMIENYQCQMDELTRDIEDPVARLHCFLDWAIPNSTLGINEEKVRIRLVENSDDIPAIRSMTNRFDQHMRSFIRQHLRPLIPESMLEQYTELLRVMISGICLSAVETPSEWPPERQVLVVNSVLRLIALPEMSLQQAEKTL